MFKQFQAHIRKGATSFFNTHLPNFVSKGTRFFGSVLDAGKTGHQLLGHLITQVGKSDLFSPQQKANLNKAHTFSNTHLSKLSDLHGKTSDFAHGVSSFQL